MTNTTHQLRQSTRMRWTQVRKAARGLRSRRGRQALRAGVAATGEHQPLLARLRPAAVIDVGANRGQFALDVEATLPTARVLSFEPMSDAAQTYRRVFQGNPLFTIEQVALSSTEGNALLHVSKHDDSSSLLAISDRQVKLFPGTGEAGRQLIRTTTLDRAMAEIGDLDAPVLLKIDVQGYELEVLRGARNLLRHIRWVYVECSFEELYSGQPLAHEVIDWLQEHGFDLTGIGATSEVGDRVIQADLLFEQR